jgi:hypothetical protein
MSNIPTAAMPGKEAPTGLGVVQETTGLAQKKGGR